MWRKLSQSRSAVARPSTTRKVTPKVVTSKASLNCDTINGRHVARSIMAQDTQHLIWIDMEMSGLNPESDRVLEIAIVITNGDLSTVAEAPVLVVHQPNDVLERMDDWNKSTHSKSG